MSTVALYTFGLLDPTVERRRMADFAQRGAAIYGATDDAPGFLGHAEARAPDPEPWGAYVLPDLPAFDGHDVEVHIATLSLWRDVDSARSFVYRGLHRDALRHRHDWFLRGAWPGHVLWTVDHDVVPHWADGVARYEALARDGEAPPDRFTFRSR